MLDEAIEYMKSLQLQLQVHITQAHKTKVGFVLVSQATKLDVFR